MSKLNFNQDVTLYPFSSNPDNPFCRWIKESNKHDFSTYIDFTFEISPEYLGISILIPNNTNDLINLNIQCISGNLLEAKLLLKFGHQKEEYSQFGLNLNNYNTNNVITPIRHDTTEITLLLSKKSNMKRFGIIQVRSN